MTVETFGDDGTPANLVLKPGSPFEGASAVSVGGAELAPFGFAGMLSSAENLAPGGLEVGWARVTSTADMAVEVVFSIANTATQALRTSTSVLPRDPTTAASFIALVSASANTAVALLNPGPGNGAGPAGDVAAQVDLRVVSRLGEVVAEESVVIAAGTKIAVFLEQLVPGLENFVGSFEVRSDLPIALLPLRQEGIQLTTQELHPARELPE